MQERDTGAVAKNPADSAIAPSPSATTRVPVQTISPVFRAGTGSRIAGEFPRGGLGEFVLHNRDIADSLVIATLYLEKDPIIAVYIRSGDSFTIDGFDDGLYDLYVSFGENWSPEIKQFTNNMAFFRAFPSPRFRTFSGSRNGRPFFHFTSVEMDLSRASPDLEKVPAAGFPQL
jgi:hypothetical protein